MTNAGLWSNKVFSIGVSRCGSISKVASPKRLNRGYVPLGKKLAPPFSTLWLSC
jgi:hypothetical protein